MENALSPRKPTTTCPKRRVAVAGFSASMLRSTTCRAPQADELIRLKICSGDCYNGYSFLSI